MKKSLYEKLAVDVHRGFRFRISFEDRSLDLDGVRYIENGIPKDGYEFGIVQPSDFDELVTEMEKLFELNYHSVPGEHEPHDAYFSALPYYKLSEEDKTFGYPRNESRFNLEYYVLVSIINGLFKWNESMGTWFWKSKNNGLIILRKWVEQNNTNN